MKTVNNNTMKFLKTITLFALCMFVFVGCSEVDDGPVTNPEAQDINAYILGLSYDADELLNVQDTGNAPSLRTETNAYNTEDRIEGFVFGGIEIIPTKKIPFR